MLAGLEFLSLAVCQFILMKVLVGEIGIASLGLWGLIGTFSQLTKLVEGGLAINAVRIAAGSKGRDTDRDALPVGIVVIAVAYNAIVALCLFVLTNQMGPFVLSSVPEKTVQLLSFASSVLFFWQSVSSVCFNVLIGLGFRKEKSFVNIACNALGAGACYFLTKNFGLIGYAFGSSVQFSLSTTLSTVMLARFCCLRCGGARKLLSNCSIGFRAQVLELMRLMFSQGWGLQTIGLTWAALEVSVKWAVSAIGGHSLVGTFELCNKFAVQFRTLATFLGQGILASMIKMVNVTSGKLSLDHPELENIYRLYRRFSVCSLLASVALLWPFLHIMLGADWRVAAEIYLALSVAVALQILAMPFESHAIAIGIIRWNWIGNVMGILFVAACFLLSQSTSWHGLMFSGWYSSMLPLAYSVASLSIIFGVRRSLFLKPDGASR